MDFKNKNVAIVSNSHGATSWIRKRLIQQGANVSDDVTEDTDILITPMINKIEQRLYGDSVQEVMSYPAFIKEFIDSDFKPAWFSSTTNKPTVFDSILIPEYTKVQAHMLDYKDMSYDDIKAIADYWGIPECEDVEQGTVLIVVPDNCHKYNIDFLKEALRLRIEKNNNAYITMSQLKVSFREWQMKHPNYHRPAKKEYPLQNRFFGTLWQMVKDNSERPYRDFSHGIWRDYIVLDTEYHNVRPEIPFSAVTEIGAVRVKNGEIVDKFYCFVTHDFFEFKTMHKYRYMDLSGETVLPVDKAIKGIIDFIGDLPIVGHNIHTDMMVLSLNGNNHKFTNPTIDTHSLLATEYPLFVPVFSLPKLADEFGLHKNSHYALDDAITTYELYELIVKSCTVEQTA